MSERIDIDRLARECDFDDLTIFRGYPPNGIVYKCTPEELTAYTRAVMEACAKACWPDPLPDSISPYMQGRIDCRDEIMGMMP